MQVATSYFNVLLTKLFMYCNMHVLCVIMRRDTIKGQSSMLDSAAKNQHTGKIGIPVLKKLLMSI